MSGLATVLGPAPRSIRWTLPAPPEWAKGDRIMRIWREADAVMERGDLVPGFLFMANGALYTPGDGDSPANVIYSFDPALRRRPGWFQELGARLYRCHGEAERAYAPQRRPWIRDVQDDLFTGMLRPYHKRVPTELTGGPVVYYSTTMIFRDHLPTRHLEDMHVSLLVGRWSKGSCLVVPPEERWTS